MWKICAANKNAYLQKTFKKENPLVINNSVGRALAIISKDQPVTSLIPENDFESKHKNEQKALNVSLSIPILLDKIQSNDPKVIHDALFNLLDEIYNPVKLVQALQLYAITR